MNPIRNDTRSSDTRSNMNIANGMNMNQIVRYSIGFAGSILLTLAAYLLVTQAALSGGILLAAITILAIIQFFVQMFYFLHLGEEARPRWRTLSFVAMAGVLLLIVFGSIWIMNNLNYHMMSPMETDQHMKRESNKGF
ncbi:cytochrome o ubiquinol oxidase subunit IV [Candidatus Saccharibacteria bacterium]|nr:MAG: cytochrome o ubiquinol oxidase subunit IV [Candidatus Saccharibacteria bacterium]